MSLAFTDSLLDQLDGSMILIGSGFVTNQVPHAFLSIQFGMIRRQVLKFDAGMGVKELLNPFSLVPRSPVNVEVDFGFSDATVKVI